MNGVVKKQQQRIHEAHNAKPLQDDIELIRELQRENKQLRRELQRMSVYRTMAYRDGLTGLYNRRYFDERIREESARAARYQGYPFGIIILDLDRFKDVNDEYGHPVGDVVLCTVADRLADQVREIDICCRLGGDEFAVLLPATDQAGCEQVATRLRRLSFIIEPVSHAIGFSLGTATYPPGPPNADAILARADQQMYQNKRYRRLHDV